ncbi:MAG: MIP family channel protein [Myxococcales bacterium]|nr:MIP family channel protein [Myxococcales bacterium]
MSPTYPLLRKAGADAVGTFALVFAGCGAAVVDAQTQALGHLGVSLVFGLVVGAMIFATGHVSGAHFNPAVTLAFAVTGSFPWKEVPAYVVAQLVAAVAASAAVLGLVGSEALLGATVPTVEVGPALGLEVLLTFFLMFVIKSVATDARASGNVAALAIGGTVALCALMGGPLTGASMNPARSLGPALMAGVADHQWLYVVGPILGAAAGAWTYGQVACGTPTKAAAGCC